MEYSLEELIDIPLLQNLQDKLNKIYSFPSAIIDNNGKVLTAVAWQDICTKFHRVNKECEKECIKSDQYIMEHIHEAEPAVSYQCPHGLVDNATPIIVDGKHLGNFFTGQFFLEKPDIEFFRKQAKKYGFDEKDYLEALEKVPIWTREKLNHYLDFIKDFIEIIAKIGLKNLKEIEANKKIRESDERNTAILQSTNDWIWEVNKDGRYTYCSEKAEKILGYKTNEIIGKTPFDFMLPEESEKIKILYQGILESKGSIVDLENWNIHKDGHHVCLLTNGVPIIDEYGEVKGYRGADKDITESKLIMNKLEESQLENQFIVENTDDILWTMNADFKIDFVTPSVYKFLGYTVEEHLKQTLYDFMTAGSAKMLIEEFQTGMMNLQKKEYHKLRNIVNKEIEFVRKDKTSGIGIITIIMLRDEQYRIKKILGKTTDITKQKQAENNLVLSENTYRGILNEASELIYVQDEEGRFLDVNYAVEKKYGYSNEYFKGKTPEFLSAPGMNDFEKIGKSFIAALKGETQRFDFWGITKAGDIFPKEVSVSLGTYFGKKAIIAVARDISERLLAEQKIKVSEIRYKTITEMATDYFFKLDVAINGKVKMSFVSENLYQITGRNIEEAMTVETWSNIIHPDDLGKVLTMLQQLIKSPQSVEIECRSYIHNHKLRWINIIARSKWDEREKRVKEITGAVKDITKRKQTEKRLEESEQKLSTLYESMTEMVALHEVIFNEKGEAENYRITDCNHAYTKITGIKKEDAIGRLATEVYQTEIAPYLKEYTSVGITGIPYEYTTFFAPLEKHFMISIVPIGINKFATITTDITEIEQKQKLIVAKNKELENYLYVASHDLRSPLVNIQGFGLRLQSQTDSIRKTLENTQLREEVKKEIDEIINEDIPKSLNFVLSSVKKMDTLINGLLQISRTGRILMVIKKTDMNQLFKNIISSHDYQITEKSAKVILNDLEECYGDENQLNQLFSNIISNALKYNNKNIPLEIEITSQINYNKVIYSVRDTGIGIASKHLEKIWDVFFRVDPSSVEAGDGIGLSLVKRIVDKHKGKIWAISEPGNGSIFFVELQRNVFVED